MPSRSSSDDRGRQGVLLIQTTGGPARLAWSAGPEAEPTLVQGTSVRATAAELPALTRELLGGRTPATVVAVVGPGSFTGVKVGLGFAHGLARGWGAGFEGVDLLVALLGAQPGASRAAVDAMRGEALVQDRQGEASLVAWSELDGEGLALDPDLAGPRGPDALAWTEVLEAGLSEVWAGRAGPPRPRWTRPSWAEQALAAQPGGGA